MKYFIFLLGTAAGRVINAWIDSLSRELAAHTGSYCPLYNHKPGLLLLRGRRRVLTWWQCLLVEILTGTAFMIAFIKFGFTFSFLAAAILTTCLIITAFIDLKHQMIPDKVVLPALTAGLLLNVLMHRGNLLYYVMGFALGGGTIYLIVFLSRGGMGGGDMKLFAAVGLFLGLRLTALALLLSFVLGSFMGLVLVVLKRKKITDAIPFGPFIALGSALSLFWGERIIAWYLGLFL